ncbi:MAG TPA: zinc ribbon domain-containing protein [Anaerolineae bacterium]|nr:zinc ribbon domain-containing protein [Anaerolineae bacterium]
MAGMTLLVVRCPACGNPLAPGDDDLAIACTQCGAGLLLADDGPQPIEIQYAQSSLARVNTWRPWWIFTGRVNLIRRETQSGNRSEEARRFWAQPRVMSVPAWELSISAVKQAGLQMLQQPPALKAIPRPSGAQLTPAVVSAEDARKMLEFLILTLEAGRDDWLKTLDFQIEAGPPQLWAIAAE